MALQRARAAITRPLPDHWSLGRREAGWEARTDLSLGQWALPMLFSADPARRLLNWDFTPQPPPRPQVVETSAEAGRLPAPLVHFVGRRAELRRWKRALRLGDPPRLLITGLGGSGKTALGREIALHLARRGFRLFIWSARAADPAARESAWRAFTLELELALNADNRQRYQLRLAGQDEAARAALLLRLLAEQEPERPLLLFFDNLEDLQDPESLRLQDETLAAWIAAARQTEGLRLLLTSRWQLPDWPAAEHLPLRGLSYGDFLALTRALAQAQPPRFPPAFLAHREAMRRIWRTLGGAARPLPWLGDLLVEMPPQDEAAFLDRLEAVSARAREDMALAALWERLSPAAQTLLARAHVYEDFAPEEGLRLLLPQAAAPLAELTARALLETAWNPAYRAREYRLPPPMADFLRRKNLLDEGPRWRAAAADYLLYLLRYERPGDLAHAARTHAALRRAGRDEAAHRLALDELQGPLQRAGLYHALLEAYLLPACDSPDPALRARALNAAGLQYHHLGDYETALGYYQESLDIRREIGDRAGEGTTLNNIAGIYDARGDYETALRYLQESLIIRREIGHRAGEGATLNNIGQIYKARGDYETALRYLQESLGIWREIGHRAGEGATLNNIGQIYKARGDYETALRYLQESLIIRREIGDRAGMAYTLFNIGHIHAQNDEWQEALSAWATAYQLAQASGLAEVLQALEGLAPRVLPGLGLPPTLAGWAALAERLGGESPASEAASQGEGVPLDVFLEQALAAWRAQSPEAAQYRQVFEQMAEEASLLPEIRRLAEIMLAVFDGAPAPDLSGLPEELAALLRRLLGG